MSRWSPCLYKSSLRRCTRCWRRPLRSVRFQGYFYAILGYFRLFLCYFMLVLHCFIRFGIVFCAKNDGFHIVGVHVVAAEVREK